MSLYGNYRSVGVCNRLSLGDLTYKSFAVFLKTYNRGGSPRTFGVGDNDGFAAFHNRHAGVSRS